MKKHIFSVVILFSCCSIMGMQKNKKLSSFIAQKNMYDPKELRECEICHKINALHRHPTIIGFMCADCSNEEAMRTLASVMCWDYDYRKDEKK